MGKIALGILAAAIAIPSLAAPAAAQRNSGYGSYSPYDFNRDGRVDASENREARADQDRNDRRGYRSGEYSPYDFNRDGRVDASENRQAQIDAGYDGYGGYDGYERARRYSPYDLNRDGRVTRREMRIAQQRRAYR